MEENFNLEKKKGRKGLIVTIIILILLLLGALGYIAYDKGYLDKLLGKEEVKEEKISKGEVTELLNTVPLYYPSTITDVKDAYQNSSITIENVDPEVLLSYASTKISEDKILKYESGMPLPKDVTKEDMLEEDEEGNKGVDIYSYLKEQDLKEIVKTTYGFDLTKNADFINPGNDNSSIEYTHSVFVYKDGYYVNEAQYSKPMSTKHSEIINYEEKDSVLTITEKWGISNCFENSCILYNSHTDDYEKAVFSCSYDKSSCNAQTLKYEFEKNKNKFNNYKHTFKKGNNGKYYWYSSEIVKE